VAGRQRSGEKGRSAGEDERGCESLDEMTIGEDVKCLALPGYDLTD
jgi:hypothetical protein